MKIISTLVDIGVAILHNVPRLRREIEGGNLRPFGLNS